MESWVLLLYLSIDLVLLGVALKYKAGLFAVVAGLISMFGDAQLISDKTLIIDHLVNTVTGALINVSLNASDVNIVVGVMSTFVLASFLTAFGIMSKTEPRY